MQDLVGVIPAAGRGVRAYPYTATIPKCMLEVDGVPLVRRNVELLREQLGIRQVRVVTGHHGGMIRDYLGDGRALDVAITYVENTRLDLELAYSVYVGTRGLETHCCVVLADECYVGTNHAELLAAADPDALATLTFVRADSPKAIRKNYVATIRDDRILALEEKPSTVRDALMGTGTYLLHPRLVARLAADFAGDLAAAPRDWTSWLGARCREGALVRPFLLRGRYVNVNSRDDLNHANYLVRDRTFERRTASLVYVVDEAVRGGIGPARRFADEPALAEVVVACPAGTVVPDELATHPKVRVLPHPDAGAPPGVLLRHGIAGARGDILVLAYSDDTVVPHDLSLIHI